MVIRSFPGRHFIFHISTVFCSLRKKSNSNVKTDTTNYIHTVALNKTVRVQIMNDHAILSLACSI